MFDLILNFDLGNRILLSYRLITEICLLVLCRLWADYIYWLSHYGFISTWKCFRLIGVSRATTFLVKCGRTFYIPTKAKRELLVSDFCPSHSSFVRRRSKFSYLRSRWKRFTLTIKKAYSRDKKGLFSWWKRFVVGMHSFKVDCCVFVSQRFGGWKDNFRCTFWLLFVVFRFADVFERPTLRGCSNECCIKQG